MQFCTKVVHGKSWRHRTRLVLHGGCKMTFSSTGSWCSTLPQYLHVKHRSPLSLLSVNIRAENVSRSLCVLLFTYWQNTWNGISCSDKCGKPHYVKHCKSVLPALHKKILSSNWPIWCCTLWRNVNSRPLPDITSFQMVRQTDCR